jgi:UDPglucose--hexose-1-phosphate uridylyltransferase
VSTETSAAHRHRVRCTPTRLSDGRELLYFDDSEPYVSGVATRKLRDSRDLGEAETAGECRYDPLTGEWVTIATHRMDRTFRPPADECPQCPTGRGTVPSEVPADDYDVVVFENRFPSFSERLLDDTGGGLVSDEPLWPRRPAVGRCEVVCFTSHHEGRFADLTLSRARTVVDVWTQRTSELSRLPGVEQVFVFENRGREIGVTLGHPHGQIYAYPFVTPRTERLLQLAEQHRERTGGSLLRDVLDAERRAASRVVIEGAHWTAYVPAAARWPVEVHLAPHRDVPDLPALDDAERDELAAVYLDLVARLDDVYQTDTGPVRLPYIAAWHQAPVRVGRDLARLHLQVTSVLRAPGKLKYLAGSESAMGAFINDTTPERIAELLRGAGPRGHGRVAG